MKKRLVFIFLVVFASTVFAQNYSDYLSSGLDAYARSDWSSAIFSFQKAEEISNGLKDEPVYWAVMANASARNYKVALFKVEFFLKQFPSSLKTGEIIYQQGRMYCLSAEHEKSINVLYGFLRRFPNHKQVPSAYYWIGENLYMSGRFKEARLIFSRVITDYPQSAKCAPARYKIALIDQGSTQDELLNLLKLSHEELLKISEEYEKSKRSYEQGIAAYQKEVYKNERDTGSAELAERLQLERKKNEELHQKILEFEAKNKELEDAVAKLNAEKIEVPQEEVEEEPVSQEDLEAAAKNADLEKRKLYIRRLKISARLLQKNLDAVSKNMDLEKRNIYIQQLKVNAKLLQEAYNELSEAKNGK